MIYRLYTRQIIGHGAFATVYKISPRRIIKLIHMEYPETKRQEYLEREIIGSQVWINALPIIKIVDCLVWSIKYRQWIKTKGMLKRYIPYTITSEELLVHRDEWTKPTNRKNAIKYGTYWDDHEDNFRKDSKGRVYIIDTAIISPNCDNENYWR